MDAFKPAVQPISRLKVLFFRLIWTARHQGLRAAARDLLQRLGLGARGERAGCAQGEFNAGEQQAALARLPVKASVTLLLAVGDDPPALQATLDSIRAQHHPAEQILLLASSGQAEPAWLADLRAHYALDMLSADSGGKLDALEGDYFGVVFPGDILAADAVGQIVLAAAGMPDAVLIYADEDQALPNGRRGQPILKPDWSPDFLLSTDYIARSVFFHRRWAVWAGGIQAPVGRAALYDLALRVSEMGPAPYHLPRRLLTRGAKTADGEGAEQMAGMVRAAVQRRGLACEVAALDAHPGLFITHLRPPQDSLTSILIATHDQPDLLRRCLESIFSLTRPGRFEVVLVDHDSRLAETRQVIADWSQREPERLRCLPYTGDFNYSRINNYAAAQARGSLLLLLNNDTQVIQPGWLDEMAGWASRPEIGAVGAVLEYPDGRIQHGGILLGMDDLAVHAFKDLPADAPGYMGRLLVPSNFLAVTGACLMVRAEVFRALGGLSEAYAVAGGDIDFCLRTAQKGMYNIVLPHVRLIHHESATRGFEDSYSKYSRLRQELDRLSRRWPEYVSRDPFYHPCLDGKGKFSPKT